MLKRENPKPLYAQLSDILREKIESEGWKPHALIPSENELSKEYGVSRMTARAVVTEFVREGLLYRVPGKGTFVAEPKITTSPPSYMGIREQLERMGYETTTRLLDVSTRKAPAKIQRTLELADDAQVYVVERLRSVKGEPLSVHTSYIPESIGDDLESKELEEEQLCVILDEEYGLKRKRIVETLETTEASASDAKLLGVKKGAPLLLLRDVIYNEKGKPFELTDIIFRGDKIKISFTFDT